MPEVKMSGWGLVPEVFDGYRIPILDLVPGNYNVEVSVLKSYMLDDDNLVKYDNPTNTFTGTGVTSFAGNVGIGTILPIANFEVVDSATEGIPTLSAATTANFQRSSVAGSSNYISIISGTAGISRLAFGDKDLQSAGYVQYNNSTEQMDFAAAGAAKAILNSTGLGLGKIPAYQLELSTDSAGKPTTNTWTITSDERIKKDIVEADTNRCYEIVKKLPLKHYGWKYYGEETAPDQTMLGWIAQDVQEVFPKAVNTKRFVTKPEVRELISPAQEAINPVYDPAGNLLNEPQEAREAVYRIVEAEEAIEDCLDLNADQINKALYGAVQKLIEKVESLEAEIKILKNN